MKKFITLVFVFFSCMSLAQTPVKNGIIYKEHPYIDIVRKIAEALQNNQADKMITYYADTAKFYSTADITKVGKVSDIKTRMQTVFDQWENIKLVSRGYPDGLEYSNDPFTVQSWWDFTATHKKTKKSVKVPMVLYDFFNKDGKISTEIIYYDSTSLREAAK